MKQDTLIPQDTVNLFFKNVEMRAWTDAEKELDSIRQKAQNTSWYRGYVKALEGLLLTYRNNDDKYIYLPKALASRTEDNIRQLQKEFSEFASNEIHGEYDRGFFKALADYVTMLTALKSSPAPASQDATIDVKTGEPVRNEPSLAPYLEGL